MTLSIPPSAFEFLCARASIEIVILIFGGKLHTTKKNRRNELESSTFMSYPALPVIRDIARPGGGGGILYETDGGARRRLIDKKPFH